MFVLVGDLHAPVSVHLRKTVSILPMMPARLFTAMQPSGPKLPTPDSWLSMP